MDENIDGAITEALRKLGIAVLTAQDDGHRETPDPVVFDRANALGRVLVSTDSDMLREATLRLKGGQSFIGLVFWHQQALPIGLIVDDLTLLARAGTVADTRDRIIFLPL